MGGSCQGPFRAVNRIEVGTGFEEVIRGVQYGSALWVRDLGVFAILVLGKTLQGSKKKKQCTFGVMMWDVTFSTGFSMVFQFI